MVETAGGYFSTGGGHNEEIEGSESPGTLRRGLRSTSYKRAVVSRDESEVSLVDPKNHPLFQPDLSGLALDSPDSPVSPTSPDTSAPTNSGTLKLPSPWISRPSSPRMEKRKGNKKNKVGKLKKRYFIVIKELI